MATYNITEKQILGPIPVNKGSSVRVTPSSGGSVTVEYSKDQDSTVLYGTATWYEWPYGSVTSERNDIVKRNVYIRFTVTAGTAIVYIDESANYPDALDNDWASLEFGGGYLIGCGATAVPVTGTTDETTLQTIGIPGGLIGPNGQVEIISNWTFTSSANNKTLRIKLGGTTFFQLALTTNANLQTYCRICNRNSNSSQVTFTLSAGTGGFGASGSAVTTGSVNTLVSQNLLLTGQLASAGETIQLESYLVNIYRP